MKTALFGWARSNRTLLTNAGSLVSTMAVSSGLGFVYWWFAARQFPAAAVGLASAIVSAMLLLGSVSSLGFGTLLITELARQTHRRASLIVTAVSAVSVAGGVVGLLFVLVLPYISTDFQPLSASLSAVTLFTLGVSLSSVAIVLDEAVIGLLRGSLQLWRNTLFAVLKLGLLVVAGLWMGHRTGLAIYATWVIGIVLSLLFLLVVAVRSGVSLGNYHPQCGLLKQLRQKALGHHALNLTLQGPSLALPILTTILLSATVNAYFYVAWMIARFVFVGPISLAVVLHAVGVAEPEVLARKVRQSLLMSVAIGLAASVVIFMGAELILTLFGSDYTQATWSLRVLALAVFPLIIRYHYIALARIQGWMAKAAAVMTIGAALELGLAAIGAKMGGLTGLSIGWATATCLEATFMARPVYRVVTSVQKPKLSSFREKAVSS